MTSPVQPTTVTPTLNPFTDTVVRLVCQYITFRDVCALRQVCRSLHDATLKLTWHNLGQTSIQAALFEYCAAPSIIKLPVADLIITPANIDHISRALQADHRALHICKCLELASFTRPKLADRIAATHTLQADTVKINLWYDDRENVWAEWLGRVCPRLQTLILYNERSGTFIYSIASHMPHLTALYVRSSHFVELTAAHVQHMTALRRLVLCNSTYMSAEAVQTVTTLPLLEFANHCKVTSQQFNTVITSHAAATLERLVVELDISTPLEARHFAGSIGMPNLTHLCIHRKDYNVNDQPPDCDMSVLVSLLSSCKHLQTLDLFVDGWSLEQVLPNLSTQFLLQLIELRCNIAAVATLDVLQQLYLSHAESMLQLLYIYAKFCQVSVDVACNLYNGSRLPTQHRLEYEWHYAAVDV